MSWIENRFEPGLIVTSLDFALNWGRKNSIWPMTFGLACCAIEMMAVGASRFDIDRFGAGAFRATPRQADLMIVAGTVNYKMAERVKRLYHQMAEPKYVIAMGARPTSIKGCNIVGLRRRGFPSDVIQKINEAIKLWNRPDVQKEQCLLEIESQYGDVAEIQKFVAFIRASETGVVR